MSSPGGSSDGSPPPDPFEELKDCSMIFRDVRAVTDRMSSVQYLTQAFDHILLTLPVRLSHAFFTRLLRKQARQRKAVDIPTKVRKTRRWLRRELLEVIPDPMKSSLDGVAERMVTVSMSYFGDYDALQEGTLWQDSLDFGRHWDSRELFQAEFRACVERFVESTTAAQAISKHFGTASGPTIIHGIRMSAWSRVEVYQWRNQLKIQDLESKMRRVSDITERAAPAVERWEELHRGVKGLTGTVYSNADTLRRLIPPEEEDDDDDTQVEDLEGRRRRRPFALVRTSEFESLSDRVRRTEDQLQSNLRALQDLNATFSALRDELSVVSKYVRLKQAEEMRRKEDERARHEAEAARLESLRMHQLQRQKSSGSGAGGRTKIRKAMSLKPKVKKSNMVTRISPPRLGRVGKSRSGHHLLSGSPFESHGGASSSSAESSRSRSHSIAISPNRARKLRGSGGKKIVRSSSLRRVSPRTKPKQQQQQQQQQQLSPPLSAPPLNGGGGGGGGGGRRSHSLSRNGGGSSRKRHRHPHHLTSPLATPTSPPLPTVLISPSSLSPASGSSPPPPILSDSSSSISSSSSSISPSSPPPPPLPSLSSDSESESTITSSKKNHKTKTETTTSSSSNLTLPDLKQRPKPVLRKMRSQPVASAVPVRLRPGSKSHHHHLLQKRRMTRGQTWSGRRFQEFHANRIQTQRQQQMEMRQMSAGVGSGGSSGGGGQETTTTTKTLRSGWNGMKNKVGRGAGGGARARARGGGGGGAGGAAASNS